MIRIRHYTVTPRGVIPTPLTDRERLALRLHGFRFTYDDTEQRIIATPPGGGFGPARVFAY